MAVLSRHIAILHERITSGAYRVRVTNENVLLCQSCLVIQVPFIVIVETKKC